jgi:plasmid maintenance system killer protein
MPLAAGSLKKNDRSQTLIRRLFVLQSNRLEALPGDRAGQFSIRINQQWRICFEWPDGDTGPSQVEIVEALLHKSGKGFIL